MIFGPGVPESEVCVRYEHDDVVAHHVDRFGYAVRSGNDVV
jgi:hypothetical protein